MRMRNGMRYDTLTVNLPVDLINCNNFLNVEDAVNGLGEKRVLELINQEQVRHTKQMLRERLECLIERDNSLLDGISHR